MRKEYYILIFLGIIGLWALAMRERHSMEQRIAEQEKTIFRLLEQCGGKQDTLVMK
jgi:hypothetical protein